MGGLKSRTGATKMASPAKKPSVEKIKSRLVECRRSQRLNFSCLDMVEFPPKFISQANAAGVSNIIELDLHSNHISTLPADLIALQTLRVLKLDHNRFHEIPSIVFSFLKLQILSVSSNGLKEIDPAVANLVMLRELDFSKNELSNIPPFFLNMSFLVTLNLADNRLSSIPDSVGTIKSLQHLDLSDNYLSDLPRALQNLEQLVHLDIHGNSITSFPPTMSHLKMLQKLNCDGNPLHEPERSIYSQGFDNYMGYLRTQYEEEVTIHKARCRPMPVMEGPFKRFRTSCGSGNWPVARTGHTLTQVDTKTIIFGGFIRKYGKVDELFSVDSRTMIWAEPTTNGCPPCARDGHSAAFDGEHCLYIFGGRNDEQKLLNDLFYLDLRSMTWAKPLVDGTLPSAREGAGMVVVGDRVLLFGGQGVHLLYNDIHILDTKTWVWTPENTKGLRPSPRQNVATIANEDLVYIHGGQGKLTFSDMYVLDVSNFTWSKINQTGLKPRFGHMIWLHKKKFYTTGGFDGQGVPDNSLYVLPFENIQIDRHISNAQATLMLLQEYSSGDSSSSKELLPKKCRIHDEDMEHEDQLSWSEVDCGIKLHDCHTISHSSDKIVILQTDLEMLEKVNVTADQAYLYWDVYMEASLECFSLKKRLREISGIIFNTRTRIFERMCKSLRNPKPFQSLSHHETNLFNHVRRFGKSFMQQFPERRPLMLMIANECGTQKLICNAIRPSQTIYTEFYDWQGPTNFLSKYLSYESLEGPIVWPSHIPSPYSVLEWSRGDCFDFSIILTSLLLGVGYDALCVVGVAPSAVSTNNQQNIVLSFEKPLPSFLLHTGSGQAPAARQTYKQDVSPVLNAGYIASLRQRRSMLIQEFVQNFLTNHDDALEQGKTDEQDNLLNFIKEKNVPGTVVPSSTVISKLEVISEDITHEMEKKKRDDVLQLLGPGRLHCWVMIQAGKRDVTESFFVEPSTGTRYSLTDSPYQAVDLVFNHYNVWINVQHKLHDPDRGSVDAVSWDFNDSSKWEKLFESDQLRAVVQSTSEGEDSVVNHGKSKPELVTGGTASTAAAGVSPSTEDQHENRLNSDTEPDVKSSEDVKTNSRSSTRMYQWILPLSWVPKLVIPMQAFVTRFPGGAKRIYYYRCEHVLFAFYGDYMRYDGMVERVMLYADDERKHLIECHDYFQRRKDKLMRRVYYIPQNKVQETFGLGKVFSIKAITTVDGQTQTFVFYPGSRVDGLLSREEVFGQQLTEIYDSSRSNGLSYQCALYDDSSRNKSSLPGTFFKDMDSGKHKLDDAGKHGLKHERVGKFPRKKSAERKKKKSGRRTRSSGSSYGGMTRSKARTSLLSDQQAKKVQRNPSVILSNVKRSAPKVLPITQITQRYAKDATKETCMQKIVFGWNHIQADFHYINGRMTATSRIYEKNGSCRMLHVDPFQPALEDFERVDEFLKLMVAERESMQRIRDAETENQAILRQRALEERNVVLLNPYTDIGMYSNQDIEDHKDVTKVESDYLSSFFPSSINPRQHLSRPQMILVRDNCLRALKERLLTRANIIQARLDTEILNLTKRRANFERDREGLTVAEEEEYERECEKAKFRIRILQQRQKHHEEKSMQKYSEMESKLRNDSRFSRLYET